MAMKPTPPATRTSEPRRRPGGRSARVVQAVLLATLEELAAAGYRALSYEAIALRAGVSRTTLYRRWPTKIELVRAAFLGLDEARPPPPDTGSVRGDVVELLGRRLAKRSPRDHGLIRAVMTDFGDPEVQALARGIATRHQAGLVAAIERGIERGELPRGTDARRVVEPIVATFFLRMTLFGEAPGPADVGAIVDLVLDGARHVPRSSSSRRREPPHRKEPRP
jgi:AcrR family transcriptional regulator